MKLSLPLFFSLSLPVVAAFTAPKPKGPGVIAVSQSKNVKNIRRRTSRLFYGNPRDPPNDDASPNPNLWSVLATTERWITSTLADSAAGNPLSRKEVSYVCETSSEVAMILANIFRKLKEARLQGETHGSHQEELVDMELQHQRSTLRQTQVLVIPGCEDLTEDFKAFDNLINAINQARRNARDYVTDSSLDKLDERMYGDGDRDWSVSVNCAHLHPKFGEMTPEERLKAMKEEEAQGEVDLNMAEYKERRLQARRSPFPSVVVEVRSTPPPDFSQASPPPSLSAAQQQDQEKVTPGDDAEDSEITSDFIDSLEALFSKSAHLKDDSPGEGDILDAIGNHLEEVSTMSHFDLATSWIAEHDPLFHPTKSAFTESDTQHVDEAYEFLFTNLAMQTSAFLEDSKVESGAQRRQYIVLSKFMTTSATSMEKFATEFKNIVETLPILQGHVELSCFHPEHIESSQRSPVPVVVLQWKD